VEGILEGLIGVQWASINSQRGLRRKGMKYLFFCGGTHYQVSNFSRFFQYVLTVDEFLR